jgi:hypothetical protein
MSDKKFAANPWEFDGDFEVYLQIMGEESLTAVPRGYEEPNMHYQNRGRPEEDSAIRDAGWCPKCKERLHECSCADVEDIFEGTDSDEKDS